MTETEVKLRVDDRRLVLERLAEAGWSETSRGLERNFVYDTADDALRRAGKLLRVREIGDRAILTVKLPVLAGGRHKVREEHEIETTEATALHALLEALGYGPKWRYEKVRAEYRKAGEPGVIEYDHTPIGDYLELEGDPEWIDRTAAELGFAASHMIALDYGTLFAEARASGRFEGEDMVFG